LWMYACSSVNTRVCVQYITLFVMCIFVKWARCGLGDAAAYIDTLYGCLWDRGGGGNVFKKKKILIDVCYTCCVHNII